MLLEPLTAVIGLICFHHYNSSCILFGTGKYRNITLVVAVVMHKIIKQILDPEA